MTITFHAKVIAIDPLGRFVRVELQNPVADVDGLPINSLIRIPTDDVQKVARTFAQGEEVEVTLSNEVS